MRSVYKRWKNKGEKMILLDINFYVGIVLGAAAAYIYIAVTGKMK